MKRFFVYQLRKNLYRLFITVAIAVLFTSSLYMTEAGRNDSLQALSMKFLLWPLSVFLPIADFTFCHDKKAVDCYYSAPITRKKLFGVKMLCGLCEIAVASVALLAAIIVLSVLRNDSNHSGILSFIPEYMWLLICAMGQYCAVAFFYTRANSSGDGVVFAVAYGFMGVLTVNTLGNLFMSNTLSDYSRCFSYFTPFTVGMSVFEEVTTVERLVCFAMLILSFIAGAYMVMSADKKKAEDVLQRSDSLWGYKTLIPLFSACAVYFASVMMLLVVFVIIIGFTISCLYAKGIHHTKKTILPLIIGICVGLLMALSKGHR